MQKLREPISSVTHFIGFLAAIPLLIWMVLAASGPVGRTGALVFGLSLMGLYGASALYHAVPGPGRLVAVLRRIDHIMIFVLIAGTYTPVCLVALPYPQGRLILTLIWCCAAGGLCLKLFWMNAPRWLYTLVYVVMGWIVVLAFGTLKQSLPVAGLYWLIAGGVVYTLGAVIYGLQPKFLDLKVWNSHDIFHLFVLGGSLCHIVFVLGYVL